jgi:hypothetical protein
MREEVYQRAMSYYRKKLKSGQPREKKSFSRFVTELIEQGLELERNLSSPDLALAMVSVEGSSVKIKDLKLDKIVEVQVSGKGSQMQLTCALDGSKNCLHVGFAYSIPDIYRL